MWSLSQISNKDAAILRMVLKVCSLIGAGHRNYRTVKGVSFAGASDEYVVSGSDDGHVFIWTTRDGVLRQWLRGDRKIVNCIEPHPHMPHVMATSGLSTVSLAIPVHCGSQVSKWCMSSLLTECRSSPAHLDPERLGS